MPESFDNEDDPEAVARRLPEEIARVRSRVEQAKARLRRRSPTDDASGPLPSPADSKAE